MGASLILNKLIKRKPFPLPKIQDLLMKLEGFTYATSLDLNMGYYHINLTPTQRSCAPLCCLGESMNIKSYPWDYATAQIYSKKR